MDPQVGPAWWGPWPGRAVGCGQLESGDGGAGTDGPRGAGMGSWTLRALTVN